MDDIDLLITPDELCASHDHPKETYGDSCYCGLINYMEGLE